MRSETEIEKMRDVIGSVVDALAKYGSEELDTFAFAFLCNVVDTLNWVLGEIPTERFVSSDYLDLERWLSKEKEMREDYL